ncbi:MAG: DNA polymerase III subunit delta [Desulfuromonas sp.]|nr:MAG: DNA polymerase III subunit delta [Desulfuromonas sp.]
MPPKSSPIATADALLQSAREHTLPPLVFLYGEETFRLQQAVQAVIDAYLPESARDFNLDTFDAKEADSVAIIDCARTYPAFADHRILLIRDAQLFQAAQLEHFLAYMREPAAESLLLFVADKIDARRKFFQTIRKNGGALVEFKKPYVKEIPAFVKTRMREAGKSLTEEALLLFCQRVGTHLQEVDAELQKLITFAGSQTLIDVEDVVAVTADGEVNSIFELCDAVGARNAAKALRALGRLLDDGTAPLMILVMITRHFRILWKLRDAVAHDSPRNELARRSGLRAAFKLDDMLVQAKRFSYRELYRAFELFLEADLAMKSSGGEPEVLLEQLLLTLCQTREMAS